MVSTDRMALTVLQLHHLRKNFDVTKFIIEELIVSIIWKCCILQNSKMKGMIFQNHIANSIKACYTEFVENRNKNLQKHTFIKSENCNSKS